MSCSPEHFFFLFGSHFTAYKVFILPVSSFALRTVHRILFASLCSASPRLA